MRLFKLNIIILICLLPSLVFARGDYYKGSATGISIPCTGTWGEGVNEAFETGSSCTGDTCSFCTTGISVGANGCTSGVTIIECSSTDWANSGTHSGKITIDQETADVMKIYANWGSAVSRLYLRFYVKPGASASGGEIINYFPMFCDDTAGAHQTVAVYWYATSNSDWRVYLYAAGLSTNYFTLADGSKYRIEVDAYNSNTCTLKVWDSTETTVLNNVSAETVTITGAAFDIQYMQFYDTYNSNTDSIFYIDDLEASAVDWVGAY